MADSQKKKIFPGKIPGIIPGKIPGKTPGKISGNVSGETSEKESEITENHELQTDENNSAPIEKKKLLVEIAELKKENEILRNNSKLHLMMKEEQLQSLKEVIGEKVRNLDEVNAVLEKDNKALKDKVEELENNLILARKDASGRIDLAEKKQKLSVEEILAENKKDVNSIRNSLTAEKEYEVSEKMRQVKEEFKKEMHEVVEEQRKIWEEEIKAREEEIAEQQKIWEDRFEKQRKDFEEREKEYLKDLLEKFKK
ncbi:MAG: hypothetical protein ABIH89_05600 [Elusimicrobiota bacterium]